MGIPFEVQEKAALDQVLTVNQVRLIEGFAKYARGLEDAKAKTLVNQWRADAMAKAQELGARVKDLHESLERLAEESKTGLRSYSDLLDERAQIKNKLLAIDRMHEALVKREERNKAIEADTAKFMDQRYEDMPGLADRRINLARYVAERSK